MAVEYNSGLYSLNEFARKTTKLAPDLFVEFNGTLGVKIVETVKDEGDSYKKSMSSTTTGFRGGITSVSTNASTSVGSGGCTLQVTCPMYKGLHESYYITNPDGTKTPFFQPMMEVKVYAKGRYLASKKNTTDPSIADNSPRYYVVFWGFVTGVNESMSGGNATFSLACKEVLYWWNYQNVAVSTSAINTSYGGKPIAPTGTILRFLNPWEIIINLFRDTAFENFIYPSFMNGGEHLPVELPSYVTGEGGAFEILTKNMGSYWKNRFSSGVVNPPETAKVEALGTLEMFGLQGKLDIAKSFEEGDPATLASDAEAQRRSYAMKTPPKAEPGKSAQNQAPDGSSTQTNRGTTTTDQSQATTPDKTGAGNTVLRLRDGMAIDSQVTQDFGLIGKVMPYANFSDNLPGPEATTLTKLEISHKATDATHMEFFQDVNGRFVFKPPFYNMDTSGTNTYRIKAEDIISINESFESDALVNGLEVTGPMIYVASAPQYSGAHYDVGSISRFGLRYRSMKLQYGNNATELRQLAVAEMTLANAQAFTASLEIPLRPEMRLGYPVYIDHLDCYYYVTGISHSFTFGSSATTSLTLNAKRPKMWKYGDGTKPPEPMRAYIYQTRESMAASSLKGASDEEVQKRALESLKNDVNAAKGQAERPSNFSDSMSQGDMRDRASGFMATPNPGLYEVHQSEAYASQDNGTSNAVAQAGTATSGRSLNEIVNITEDSVPYTDVNGYLHIGGFPFGANLSISDRYSITDLTQLGVSQPALDLLSVLQIKPESAPATPDPMAQPNTTPPSGTDSTVDARPYEGSGTPFLLPPEDKPKSINLAVMIKGKDTYGNTTSTPGLEDVTSLFSGPQITYKQLLDSKGKKGFTK